MALRLQIRRGAAAPAPANLEDYELGLNTSNQRLYTKISGVIYEVGCGNANLLDGLNSTQFLRSDQSDTLTGDLTVTGTVYSTAQEALYADVAENYETDREYETGDILMVGIDTEATLADGSRPLIGVVSDKPAYLLNGGIEADNFAPVALKGRIPVKISGSATRGQFIVLDTSGVGKAVDTVDYSKMSYIGIALSSDNNGTVEVKV